MAERLSLNTRIEHPLQIRIRPGGSLEWQEDTLLLPADTGWFRFQEEIRAISSEAYDSVLVSVDGTQFPGMYSPRLLHQADMKITAIGKEAAKAQKPLLHQYEKQWYLLNAPYEMSSEAKGYAPSNEEVQKVYDAVGDPKAWRKHQGERWGKIANLCPLQDGTFGVNHKKLLTEPKRGLEEKDLKDFWSLRNGKVLCPGLLDDNLVGLPGLSASVFSGFTMTDRLGTPHRIQPLCIKLSGLPGAAIPMPTVDGAEVGEIGGSPRYQVMADLSPINVVLKARAADGVTIRTSDFFDKKTGIYSFVLKDGTPSKLQVCATEDPNITFSDVNGQFTVPVKTNIKPVLLERGYVIPDLIDTLKPIPSAKYIWQGKGTMIGSGAVADLVTSADAGVLVSRKPKEGETRWVCAVVEGALKGHIVSKYLNVADKNGITMADKMAGKKGVLVVQVPGVSRSFVESAKGLYDKYDVAGTYICMDADGRDNRNVAKGIASAYASLKEVSAVTVLSWDPKHKGFDDALLAVSRGEIAISELGLCHGTPEKLFPISEAKDPVPYTLSGGRGKLDAWKEEYEVSKKEQRERIGKLQEASAELDAERERNL